MKTCFIDTEFTYIYDQEIRNENSISYEVIQIAAVIMDEKGDVKSFSEYIHPRFTSISSRCRRLTHIDNSMVRSAPDFVCWELMNWIGDANDLVTYSWSNTDYLQLRDEASAKGITDIRFQMFLESFKDYQKIFQDYMSVTKVSKNQLSLENAARLAGVEYEEKELHNALGDAKILAGIYRKCNLEKNIEDKSGYLYEMLKGICKKKSYKKQSKKEEVAVSLYTEIGDLVPDISSMKFENGG